MPQIVVSQIPMSFSENTFRNALEQLNIVPDLGWKMVNSRSMSKFVILTFETQLLADQAIDQIRAIKLRIDNKDVTLQSMPFVPSFGQFVILNPQNNLMVANLPPEMTQQDILSIFTEFGRVLSIKLLPTAEEKPKAAFVLFEKLEEAQTAIFQANGKFLGPYQLFINVFKTPEQRVDENREILIYSLPKVQPKEHLLKLLADAGLGHCVDTQSAFTILTDARPEEINSQGVQLIFNATNHQTGQLIIDCVNAANLTFDTVKERVSAVFKLPKGLAKKLQLLQHNRFASSGRNVKVFNIRIGIALETVRQFFEQFGEIESFSPPRTLHDNAYYIILFKFKDGAMRCLDHAPQEEVKLGSRIATLSGLRVELDVVKRSAYNGNVESAGDF